MAALICESTVRTLLKAAICYIDYKPLTDYLNSQTHPPNWDAFLIVDELKEKYWHAWVALQRELIPNYINVQDLTTSLWNLFKDVVINRKRYTKKEELQAKLAEFCAEVKKPLFSFDVIYEIKNFDVGEASFTLNNVEVFKLTADRMQALGIKSDALFMGDWLNKSVAKIVVNASSIERTYESGISIVKPVIDITKLIAAKERIFRLDDEMFLWELGSSLILQNGKLQGGSYARGLRPLIVPLGNTIQEGLKNENTWNYLIDDNLPKDIKTRLQRALEWISSALTTKSLDHKLVNLCTALEILLLPSHTSGTKGEPIAIRQVLLGRSTHYVPTAIWGLYEKRSLIIHEGTLEITSYLDYWHLLICSLQVLKNILVLSRQNPGITELKDLIGLIETKESLSDFIRNCDTGLYKGRGINKMREAAKNRLQELNK